MDDHLLDSIFEQATKAILQLKPNIPEKLQSPSLGIICGSGLGGLANSVLPDPRLEVQYQDIPYFPKSTGKESGVVLHAGESN